MRAFFPVYLPQHPFSVALVPLLHACLSGSRLRPQPAQECPGEHKIDVASSPVLIEPSPRRFYRGSVNVELFAGTRHYIGPWALYGCVSNEMIKGCMCEYYRELSSAPPGCCLLALLIVFGKVEVSTAQCYHSILTRPGAGAIFAPLCRSVTMETHECTPLPPPHTQLYG